MGGAEESRGSGNLVGRDREIELIERLLEEVEAGGSHFVLLEGEPGIGKTRLLELLADDAETRGWLVLDGRASEFERDQPSLRWWMRSTST